MKSIRIYDLPTRLFHWIFAILFIGAFFIAKTMDDDSPLYPYHMMMGMTLGVSVILRFIWGVIGSRYARFSSFDLKPGNLFNYFKTILSPNTILHSGHNPASSWSAIAMMLLALGLGFSGFQMVNGNNKEFFEEVHELLANSFVIIAIFHVAGILFHMFRHRDFLGLSMIHGSKTKLPEGTQGIENSHFPVGIVFVVILAAFVFQLNKNYNPATQSLNLFGKILQLGEAENQENESEHSEDSEHE